MPCGSVMPRKHLHTARRCQLAIGARSRLIIFPGKCHGFGGELPELDQIRVMEPLQVDVRVHGCTITQHGKTLRDPGLTFARLRRRGAASYGEQFTSARRTAPRFCHIRARAGNERCSSKRTTKQSHRPRESPPELSGLRLPRFKPACRMSEWWRPRSRRTVCWEAHAGLACNRRRSRWWLPRRDESDRCRGGLLPQGVAPRSRGANYR
jgi:hypothetical protein